MLEFFEQLFEAVWKFIVSAGKYTLFSFAETDFTVKTVAIILAAVWALFYTSKKFSRLLSEGILKRRDVEPGVRYSLGTLFRYMYLAVGLIIIVQTMGVNLTALQTVLGFLSVGIGFGLQNITNNLVSGIIIMLERPIKIGDRVEVGNLTGNVQKISIRATTIITNDNMSIIVPNSEFISAKVINWSHVNKAVLFRIPVGAAYGDDPQRIAEVLTDVARQHPGVCAEPPPVVTFDKFGDNALEFSLWVATETYISRPGALRSELNFAIHAAFRRHSIEIPFPQREIHIKTTGMPGLPS